MGARLPLYLPGRPLALGGSSVAIDGATPLDRDEHCSLCSLGAGATTVCIATQASREGAGGVLLVSDKPSREEDRVGSIDAGGLSNFIWKMALRVTPPNTRLIINYAVRCAPGATEVDESMVAACRGYLANIVKDLKPDRIVCFGATAAEAVLGRRVQPLSARRSYALTGSGIPVFVVLGAGQANRNRLLSEALEADLKWAVTYDPPEPCSATYSMVKTAAEAAEAVSALRVHGRFAYDCEWIGRPYGRSFYMTNLAAAVCQEDGPEHVYVWDGYALADLSTAEPLKILMQDAAVKKVGSNLAVDVHAVRRGLGVPVRGQEVDVRIQRKLLEADADGDLASMAELVGLGGHKEEADAEVERISKTVRSELKSRAKAAASNRLPPSARFFPHVPVDVEALAFQMAAVKGSEARSYALGLLPPDIGSRYNGRDALVTARLWKWCRDKLAEPENVGQAWVWERILRHAVPAVQRVEEWGVGIDAGAVQIVRAHLDARLQEVDARLAAYVPEGFCWNSPQQVAKLLYNDLKLPCAVLTSSNRPSTAEDALEKIRGKHPCVDDILEHRRLEKLRGTYVEGLERSIGIDGRAHGYILLDGAGTGRTSMQDPNFQNVPRADSPEGQMIRRCIIAGPRRVLVELDYSQLEPRVAALLSGDIALIRVFVDGRDFHGETARLVQPYLWPKAPLGPDGQVTITKDQRQEAKPIGLAALYGKGAWAMAQTLGCSKEVAQAALDAIIGKYKTLGKWIRDSVAFSRRAGYLQTWWEGRPARRRPLWNITSGDENMRGTAERGAYNGRVQGTGSDFCVRSIAEVVRLIDEEGLPAKLLLPIHDSLLLECCEVDAAEVIDAVKTAMLSWDSGGIPLDVDVKVGLTWGSMMSWNKWRDATVKNVSRAV
jgi:uracil-DNA glycosylase family 4